MEGQFAKKVWYGFDKAWQGIAVSASVVCFVLVLLQIFLRYFLRHPLMGIEEIVCMVAFWAYFMGSVHGTFEGSHIQADIVQSFLKNRKAIEVGVLIKCAVTFAIAFVVSLWAIDYLIWGIKKGEKSPFLMIPRVYSQSAITIGLMIMCIYFFSDFFRSIKAIVRRCIDNRNNK